MCGRLYAHGWRAGVRASCARSCLDPLTPRMALRRVVYHGLCTTPEQPRFFPPEWFVTLVSDWRSGVRILSNFVRIWSTARAMGLSGRKKLPDGGVMWYIMASVPPLNNPVFSHLSGSSHAAASVHGDACASAGDPGPSPVHTVVCRANCKRE